MKYKAFLTHNWGKMPNGTFDVHERVLRIAAALKAKGYAVWIDAERMTGAIVQQMCDGIDDSEVIVVFITQAYIDKVRGINGAGDNCLLEFNYAMTRKTKAKMVAVVLEEGCRNSKAWLGPVGMALGPDLYVDFCSEDDFDAKITQICVEIENRTNSGAISSGQSVPPFVPPPSPPNDDFSLMSVFAGMFNGMVEGVGFVAAGVGNAVQTVTPSSTSAPKVERLRQDGAVVGERKEEKEEKEEIRESESVRFRAEGDAAAEARRALVDAERAAIKMGRGRGPGVNAKKAAPDGTGKRIWDAAKTGDMATLRPLAEEWMGNAVLNCDPDHDGYTPLHVCSSHYKLQAVRLLLATPGDTSR